MPILYIPECAKKRRSPQSDEPTVEEEGAVNKSDEWNRHCAMYVCMYGTHLVSVACRRKL